MISWPEDKPIAICVNIMCEMWTDESAPGVGPMGNPLAAGYLDTQARSWAAYGMTTGADRLLDIVADTGVPCGTYVSGIIAERHPEILKRIDGDGHFIGAHAWAQNVLPVYQERADEEADLVKGIELFKSVHGKAPKGFISPRGTPSLDTVELLVKHGFKWHSDHFDRDVPYMIDNEFGDLAAVPFTMEVNDMPLYVRYGNEPEAFTRILERILDGFAETHTPKMILDLTVHAHVFGHPFGAIELRKSIEAVQQRDNVWITTHEELAKTVHPDF